MFSKILFTLLSRLSNVLITLGVSVIISNGLGASGKGDQAGILLGITLVCLFMQVAGGTALVYLTPRFPGWRLLKVAYVWIFFAGLAGWALLLGVGAIGVFETDILVISIIHSIWSANSFYLLGKEKSNWFNGINFLQSTAGLAYLGVVYFFGTLELYDYITSLYIGHGTALVLSFFALSGNVSGESLPARELLPKFIKHGGYIQLANLGQLLKYRIHFYLILAFMGKAELGIYSNALAIAEGVWILSRSIAIVQFSKVANLSDDYEARKITLNYTWLSLLLSIGAMGVLLFVPDRLFTLVFGKDFTGIHELLIILSPAIIALSASNLFSHYFSGTGKNHINTIGSFLGLAITAAIGYWLIPRMGLKGAAVSTSIAFTVTALFHWIVFSIKGKPKNP